MSKWGLFLPPHQIIPCCWYNQPWPQSEFYSSVAPSGKRCNWLVGEVPDQSGKCLALCSDSYKHIAGTVNVVKIKCSLTVTWQELRGLKRRINTINEWLTPGAQLTFPGWTSWHNNVYCTKVKSRHAAETEYKLWKERHIEESKDTNHELQVQCWAQCLSTQGEDMAVEEGGVEQEKQHANKGETGEGQGGRGRGRKQMTPISKHSEDQNMTKDIRLKGNQKQPKAVQR